MTKTREYVRQSESMQPGSVEFHVFVQQQMSAGKVVDCVAARRWVMSAYKRESLIRFGARRIASDALALERKEDRETAKTSMTLAAIGFTKKGESISESESEFFYSSGIAVVMHRLKSARSYTYVYDKRVGVFSRVDMAVTPKARGNGTSVRAIFDVLSVKNSTAAEIASDRGCSVSSVRSILSSLFNQGRVSKVSQARPGSKELVWGLVREAATSVGS
jgi:hypothetical protein